MEVENERMWKMSRVFVLQVSVVVYLRNFSKKIQNNFLLIFLNWITWNWNVIKCEKFPGHLCPKWSGHFTFEYFRKKSKFLFYSFFRITSFTTEWWENVKYACLKKLKLRPVRQQDATIELQPEKVRVCVRPS